MYNASYESGQMVGSLTMIALVVAAIVWAIRYGRRSPTATPGAGTARDPRADFALLARSVTGLNQRRVDHRLPQHQVHQRPHR